MARRSTKPLISASRRRTHVLTGGSASSAAFLDPTRRPFALALEAIASSSGSAKPSTGVSDPGSSVDRGLVRGSLAPAIQGEAHAHAAEQSRPEQADRDAALAYGLNRVAR